jgi:hypothetical protein
VRSVQSEERCPRREAIEGYCSCPKLDCPRHGLCCECILAHKGRIEDPVLKRLPHCLRDLVAASQGGVR